MNNKPFETAYTTRHEVHCDGGTGPLGHPRVFLHIDHATNDVVCPYCSKRFVYMSEHDRKAG